ncbi:uncharacterized protein LOC126882882 isoform X2 [Diabrotica virgifera virgifera]|uniref:Uncharacterized protein n=1 Tax=Diabrotica virgifera virgifera TaxID=50390 RepID=A0ABM5K137_DIAVI|nr:uncharacterized protein LOC126882882 isoform X2 [Diabrotica virgifera virgifera]
MKNIKIYTAVFVLSLAFNGLMAQSEEIFGQFEFIEYINSLFDNALDVIHQLLQENNAQLRNGVNNFVNFLKSVLPPLPSPLPSLPSLPDQMEISDALYKYVREILEYFSKVIPIAQKVLKDLPPMSLPDLPSTLDLEAINIVISPWLREHQGIIVIAILKIYSQVPPPPKMPDVSQTMVGILAQILVPAIPPDVQFLVNAAVSSLLPELSIGLPPAVILS